MVLYEPCCTEHGEYEISYYDTLVEAEANAYSDYKIFVLIKEIK